MSSRIRCTTQLARLEISGGPPCETHGYSCNFEFNYARKAGLEGLKVSFFNFLVTTCPPLPSQLALISVGGATARGAHVIMTAVRLRY